MKMPIEWHEECLVNHHASLNRIKQEFKRHEENLLRATSEYEFRKLQIEEAKRQGKDGFDSERFLKKRAAKASD